MNEKVFIRINGIGHAFSRELGCKCDRCGTVKFDMERPPAKLGYFKGWDDPPWRAHTSASILIANDDGSIKHHILIDVGAGVVDSLMCSGLEGLDQVRALLITHWHPDHVLGLNQLCESMKRSAKRNKVEFKKIPLFCTRETYDYLRDKGGQAYVFDNFLDRNDISSKTFFKVDSVKYTPISVAHGGIDGAVIFVAEVASKKVVFAWDIDIPDKNQKVMEQNQDTFANTDILFIAANTWAADETEEGGGKKTGHSSYERAKKYIEHIAAKDVYLVHMSGHEDGEGKDGYGWTDSDWESNVKPYNVARQGMLIEL